MARTTRTQDLEASTFQGRPCYRYIRQADQVPSTDEALGQENPMALVKLFDPTGSWTWYIAGYDPQTRFAWGRAHGQEDEYGYFSMAEIVDFRSSFYGLPIERDLHWTPRPIKDCHPS